MTTFIFANNINTELAGGISPGSTTLTLSSTLNLPTSIPSGSVLVLTLNDQATKTNFEIVYVTAISGATLTVNRAQEGTSAKTWLTGDFAFSGPTAGQMQSFVQGSSGVTPGSYGSSTQVATFTVGSNGLLTAAGNVAIAFPITSFNGRGGAVTLSSGDVTTALGFNPLGAAIAADTLLGNPTNSSASPTTITLANGLVFSGTALGLGSITVTGMSNSGSASITGNLTVGGNATVSGNISVVGSGTPEIEMKSTGTGGHDWFLVSVGPSWGGGLSAGCLSFFDNTAGANRGYFDPSGNLNLLNFLYVNEYLISTSQYTVLANNGSNGAILLRPNGAFSATGQLELDSSGAVTINGNLTVTGTINFDTSDATLKDLGDPIEPRPFHRLPYHAYRRLDTGSRGWGPTAQGVASIAPEYTDRRTMLVGGEDRSVLFMSKQQITMDTAFWAGRQVDLLWEEIQRLRDELQAYGAH